ncbi:carbonate dehydratase [Candidatus Phycorickettsia trachydisci]|uniref:Carbonic anhydrase n=1 Tax=Candidatus Phycorickettsia trachydisci TaxID=2115978 RepID=A0A2P1P7J6_9RICK|nr:carbonic anhydrase [Candidatus Phycorickettsia trachydisci]AVP87240.1 carbonate dehydratase [Candidatus Phycorickettsia trachydisci]
MPKNLHNLIDGYKEFRKNYFSHHKALFDNLSTHGQSPKILIIACSDSRVDPAIVTNAIPGDLFVIRNVANLVPNCEEEDLINYHGTSAAIEYAVCDLKVRHIIVCGHAKCGGLTSMFNTTSQKRSPSFMNKWVSIAKNPFNKVHEKYFHESLDRKIELLAKESLINSLSNLKTFPWLSEKVKQNDLFLHAWYFEIATCNIQFLDTDGAFKDLAGYKY